MDNVFVTLNSMTIIIKLQMYKENIPTSMNGAPVNQRSSVS